MRDNTAPDINYQANIVVSNDFGKCEAKVTYNVLAKDNCGTVTVSYAPPSGSFFTVGTKMVTVTATDECGNKSSKSFNVIVKDTEKPVAKCKPATVTLLNGTAVISASDVDDGSTDNCGIQSVTVAPKVFTCSNIGINNVELTITDIHGNVSKCQTTVEVVGELPTCSITSMPSDPTFTGGVPTNLYLGYGPTSTKLKVNAPASGAPYTYSWAPSTGLNSTITGDPTFTPTAEGTYTFVVTTTNKFGCKATCSITICVLDIRVPGTNGKKVYVCHTPPGNPTNVQLLSVSVNAVSAHIFSPGHGDRLGRCDQYICSSAAISSISSSFIEEDELPKMIEAISFKVTAFPNPSNSDFSVIVKSPNVEPIQVRVLDMFGREVFKQSNVSANSMLRIGQKFHSGVYTIEALQGNKRQLVKVIKLK